MTSDPITGSVPLPALLAGGATVVVGTAAALTGRAATRPDLPATRWHRPLPPGLTAAADHPATRAAVRAAGVAVTATTLVLLVTAGRPVDGTVAVPVVVAASMLCAPLVRLANPVRLLDRPAGGPGPTAAAHPGPPAVVGLALLAAVALASDDGRVLAVALAAHLLAQGVLAVRHGPAAHARHDPFEAVAALVAPLAPIGRDPDGRLAWRNPLVTTAHTTYPTAAAWLTAVLMGMALHLGAPGTGARPVVTAAVAALAGRLVLRLGVIRGWFTGVLAPLAAAHGLLASGRWLAPLDLVAFVGLHAVAMAVLHRQALSRHDLRAARAVQLPPRLAVLVSVLAGLAVTASGT